MWRQTWAEIDLGRLRHNVAVVQAQVGKRVKILASVKANAYGHGVVEVSKALLSVGVHGLGVATIEEAVELRDAGIVAPILCYGALAPGVHEVVAERQIAVSVMNTEEIARLASAARVTGRGVDIHVKVDTGMGRLGVRGEMAFLQVMRAATSTDGVRLRGVYTHFSSADDPLDAQVDETRTQAQELSSLVARAREVGIDVPLVHAANSAAIFRDPQYHFDWVRPGIALYGYHPFSSGHQTVELLPVLSLYTRIVRVADMPPGATVSYGRTFVCEKPEQIATLPIGYADGLPRALSNAGRLDLGGHNVQIAGRVCMDQTMIVTTGLHAKPGDVVRIYGGQEHAHASLADAARQLGTIPYELLCAISSRVPRIYV